MPHAARNLQRVVPILLPHELPGAPPVSGIPPDLLSSENDPDSSEPERGGALRIRVAAGGTALSAVADSSEASSDAGPATGP